MSITQIRKKAIGYARVSTGKQGLSLESQCEKIAAMATVHDADLEIITDAGETAKHTSRPGLQRMLELVSRGEISMVIILKLDRLTRSVKDLAELLELFAKRNVSLISVSESLDTGSAAGRLVINILVSVGQWERESVGERTRTALRHKRAHGKVFNHVLFGFSRRGDQLLPVAAEQAIINQMRLWRANGWPLRRIANALNNEQIPTKRSAVWHPETVRNILARLPNNEGAE
jgi:DNA invertase Pin-like site-specific DNA recombinase